MTAQLGIGSTRPQVGSGRRHAGTFRFVCHEPRAEAIFVSCASFQDVSNDLRFGASQALLTAALGGLLSVAAACTSHDSSSGANAASGSSDSTLRPTAICDAGVPANPSVTSTTTTMMTQAQFQTQCDGRHGEFIIQPHCGGANACRGMSYDVQTQAFTEHSCRGTNTCAGYTCIIC